MTEDRTEDTRRAAFLANDWHKCLGYHLFHTSDDLLWISVCSLGRNFANLRCILSERATTISIDPILAHLIPDEQHRLSVQFSPSFATSIGCSLWSDPTSETVTRIAAFE